MCVRVPASRADSAKHALKRELSLLDHACAFFAQVVAFLVRDQGLRVYVEPATKRELPAETALLQTWEEADDAGAHASPPADVVSNLDLIVTLGGDGTVLWASSLLGEVAMPPVVALALGSLGFMTPLPATHLKVRVGGV